MLKIISWITVVVSVFLIYKIYSSFVYKEIKNFLHKIMNKNNKTKPKQNYATHSFNRNQHYILVEHSVLGRLKWEKVDVPFYRMSIPSIINTPLGAQWICKQCGAALTTKFINTKNGTNEYGKYIYTTCPECGSPIFIDVYQ